MLHQIVVHITTERLYLRDEHTSIRHRVTLHIVVVSIAVRLVVIVEAVGTEHTDDRGILHLLLRDVTQIDTRGVALIFHIETKLVLLHLRSEIIDVLHHQVPVALLRIATGILQRLHEERLLGIADVGGKLTHLVSHATRCVFVSNGKHLVGLQSALQRYISHGSVDRIFGRTQQSGALQFLKVGTTNKSASLQGGGCLVDVTCSAVLTYHRLILGVGLVGWHQPTGCPHFVAQLGGLA